VTREEIKRQIANLVHETVSMSDERSITIAERLPRVLEIIARLANIIDELNERVPDAA
jgi:hypothetical protein